MLVCNVRAFFAFLRCFVCKPGQISSERSVRIDDDAVVTEAQMDSEICCCTDSRPRCFKEVFSHFTVVVLLTVVLFHAPVVDAENRLTHANATLGCLKWPLAASVVVTKTTTLLNCAYQCTEASAVSCFGVEYTAESSDCLTFDAAVFVNASAWRIDESDCVSRRRVLTNTIVSTQLVVIGCSQSTGGVNDCQRAIDGNTNQVFGAGSCTHTDHTNNQWWQAELSRSTLVTKVIIYNRSECCQERLNSFTVSVDSRVCVDHNSSVTFLIKEFNCMARGEYLLIRNRLFAPLTLCEVLVFGIV